MFWNIYSKRILRFFRDRETMIWTWIFPLLLATMFFAVFTNLDTSGQFSTIPIAVVDNDAYQKDSYFQAALNSVSSNGGGASESAGDSAGGDTDDSAGDSVGVGVGGSGGSAGESAGGSESLFDLQILPNQAEADALLEAGEIDAYILYADTPTLFVADSRLRQTIIKSFLDNYLQTAGIAETLILQGAVAAGDVGVLISPLTYTEQISLSDNPPTSKVGYFYALLAMVCMYGGFQGLVTITGLQANLSALGARRTLAPGGRIRMVAYDLLGGLTTHFLCLIFIVAYINFVLGVSFGPKLWPVLLTCLAGSLLGITFGAMVSVSSKMKEQAKIAVLISVTMVCSFLAGLMFGGINYTVAQKAPLIAWLNPLARIADALYCLYYYDTYERYFLNIGIVLAMSAAMLAVTAIFVRRQRYESI